ITLKLTRALAVNRAYYRKFRGLRQGSRDNRSAMASAEGRSHAIADRISGNQSLLRPRHPLLGLVQVLSVVPQFLTFFLEFAGQLVVLLLEILHALLRLPGTGGVV